VAVVLGSWTSATTDGRETEGRSAKASPRSVLLHIVVPEGAEANVDFGKLAR
jgi:hypothetical protein